MWMIRSFASALAIATLVTNVSADEQVPPAQEQPVAEPAAVTEEVPEVAYIDPADFLPRAFGRIVEEAVVDVPLTDVVSHIAELAKMPCRVVEYHFEKERIPLDVLVTLRAGLPLYMSLDRMCWEAVQPGGQRGTRIAWVINQGILTITTQPSAWDWMQNQAWNIGDVLDRCGHNTQLVIDIIQAHTPDAEWMDIDGIGGECDAVGDVLMIRQTFATQRKIARLLEAMQSDARMIYVNRAPQTARIEAAMTQPIHGSLDRVALADVLRTLQDQSGIEFRFDPIWQFDQDLPFDSPISYTLVDRDLQTTLGTMLHNIAGQSLDYYVRDDAIWVMHELDAYAHQETIVYRVDNVMPNNDFQAMIDLFEAQTSGEWIDIDGTGGEIDPVPPHNLIVTQAPSVHRQIQAILAMMRQTQLSVASNPDDIVMRCYTMSAEMAIDLTDVLPKVIASDTWAEPADAESGKAGRIYSVRRDGTSTVLVVVQTRRVHEQIADLISQISPSYGAGPCGFGIIGFTPEE